ncbi:MAG: hypothetical protein NPIRA02_10710 [Nitrospirales bacterium]|nr:MAG: hypothetical protein NPIRA02_10710 [Nitrospirales bacterium]
MKSARLVCLSLFMLLVACGVARASVLSDTANNMQPGEWRQMPTNGLSASFWLHPQGTSAGPATQFFGKAAWCNGRVRFISSGHNSRSQYTQYYESDNTWRRTLTFNGVARSLHHGYYNNTCMTEKGRLAFGYWNPSQHNIYTILLSEGSPENTNQLFRGADTGKSGNLAETISWFPERDRVVSYSGTGRWLQEWDPDSNTWQDWFQAPSSCQAGGGQVTTGYYHTFSAYNPVKKTVIFGGGNGPPGAGYPQSRELCSVDQSGSITEHPAAPTDLNLPHIATGSLMEIDPVSGNVLVVRRDGEVYELNTTSNSWRQLPNHPMGDIQNGAVSPIAEYGVMLYMVPHDKVWLYKHAVGVSSVVNPEAPDNLRVSDGQVTPPPPPSSAGGAVNTSFASICNLPTTIYCQDFNAPLETNNDAASQLADRHEGVANNNGPCESFAPGGRNSCPQVEDGALKFTIATNSGSGDSGFYHLMFSQDTDGASSQPDGTDDIHYGESVYVQWRQKFSREFLDTVFIPGSGWKQGMIGADDEFSCASNEIVLVDTNQRNYVTMYHGCGFNEGSESRPGGTEIWYQPGGDRNCPRSEWVQINGKTRGVEPHCDIYYPDEWMTFQMVLQRAGPGEESHIELWTAREGHPQKLTISWDHVLRNDGKGHGRLWLLPYQTNKSREQSHPTSYMWYDQVIVSETFIASPTP